MLRVVFVPKVYVNAIGGNNTPVSHHKDTASLFLNLRATDLNEIQSYSRALVKILNSGNTYNGVASALDNTDAMSDTALTYVEYVSSVVGKVGSFKHARPKDVTIAATADGTIVFLEEECDTEFSYEESILLEYGKVKGVESMLALPTW